MNDSYWKWVRIHLPPAISRDFFKGLDHSGTGRDHGMARLQRAHGGHSQQGALPLDLRTCLLHQWVPSGNDCYIANWNPWPIETVDLWIFPFKMVDLSIKHVTNYQWVTQLTQQTEARCAPQGRWFCREDWEVTSWLGIHWPDPKIAYFSELNMFHSPSTVQTWHGSKIWFWSTITVVMYCGYPKLRQKHNNGGITIINHPFWMVYTTYFRWFGGWFIIVIPTFQSPYIFEQLSPSST